METDRWTGFTRHFTHLKTNEEPKDAPLLLIAILADATNLGLAKMAESCPGTSLAKLSWLVAWHIRDETYSRALAELVNHQHRYHLPRTGVRERPPHPTASASAPAAAAKPPVR